MSYAIRIAQEIDVVYVGYAQYDVMSYVICLGIMFGYNMDKARHFLIDIWGALLGAST